MSRLGAKLKVERPEENAVKAACEWTLVFMLLFHERRPGAWYETTTEIASRYPGGSYRNVFWWAARDFFGLKGPKSWEDFRGYLDWKIEQYDLKRIHRDGPRW